METHYPPELPSQVGGRLAVELPSQVETHYPPELPSQVDSYMPPNIGSFPPKVGLTSSRVDKPEVYPLPLCPLESS